MHKFVQSQRDLHAKKTKLRVVFGIKQWFIVEIRALYPLYIRTMVQTLILYGKYLIHGLEQHYPAIMFIDSH